MPPKTKNKPTTAAAATQLVEIGYHGAGAVAAGGGAV